MYWGTIAHLCARVWWISPLAIPYKAPTTTINYTLKNVPKNAGLLYVEAMMCQLLATDPCVHSMQHWKAKIGRL